MAFDGCSRIVVKTGNVINNNDILKRPGKTAANELWEGLKSTLANGEKTKIGSELVIKSSEKVYTNDVVSSELLTTVKIFMDSDSQELLKEAIVKSLNYLDISKLSILVLAFHPGGPPGLGALKNLWSVLQSCVDDGTVELIGVSDVDTEVFIELYDWARVKPSIVQISLAGCCIVPPPLQVFTKEHDIQLLTHSDPQEILPKEKLEELFPHFPVRQTYLAKFQAHIKCRGVLATKGYLLCVHRDSS